MYSSCLDERPSCQVLEKCSVGLSWWLGKTYSPITANNKAFEGFQSHVGGAAVSFRICMKTMRRLGTAIGIRLRIQSWRSRSQELWVIGDEFGLRAFKGHGACCVLNIRNWRVVELGWMSPAILYITFRSGARVRQGSHCISLRGSVSWSHCKSPCGVRQYPKKTSEMAGVAPGFLQQCFLAPILVDSPLSFNFCGLKSRRACSHPMMCRWWLSGSFMTTGVRIALMYSIALVVWTEGCRKLCLTIKCEGLELDVGASLDQSAWS